MVSWASQGIYRVDFITLLNAESSRLLSFIYSRNIMWIIKLKVGRSCAVGSPSQVSVSTRLGNDLT